MNAMRITGMMKRKLGPGKHLLLPGLIFSLFYISSLASAEPGLELVMAATEKAEAGDRYIAPLILESFYPAIGKSPEFQSHLALGLALSGHSSHAVEVINYAMEKDALPADVVRRLVRAACFMEQHTLANACAYRIKDPSLNAERTEIIDSVQKDLESKRSGASFDEIVAMLRAAATFESARATEPESVQFSGHPGILKGYLIKPKNSEGVRYPAIISFPGGAWMDQPPPPREISSDELTTALAYVQQGYVFLFLIPRGSIAGTGVYWSDQKAATDLSAAASYLSTLPEVNAKRIYAYGNGSGGTVVLWSLSLPGSLIRAAVACAPRSDPRTDRVADGKPIYASFTPAFLESRSLAVHAGELMKPGLVIQGMSDPEPVIEETRRFEEKVGLSGQLFIQFKYVNESDYSGDIMRGPGFTLALDFLKQLPEE